MRVLILLAAIISFNTSYAVKRWGTITNGLNYDRIVIKQDKKNTCKLSIEIENTSKKLITNYRFKIFAFDIHNQLEWTVSLSTGAIQASDDKTLNKTIRKCSVTNPYKLEFKGKALK